MRRTTGRCPGRVRKLAAQRDARCLWSSRCPILQGGHQESMRPLFSRFQKPEPCEEQALEVRRRWGGRFWVQPDIRWGRLRGMPRACTSPSGQPAWGRVPEESPPLAGKAPPPSCPGLLGGGESWGVPDPSSILGRPEPRAWVRKGWVGTGGTGQGGGGWGQQRRGRGGGRIERAFQTDESALPPAGRGAG